MSENEYTCIWLLSGALMNLFVLVGTLFGISPIRSFLLPMTIGAIGFDIYMVIVMVCYERDVIKGLIKDDD